MTIVVNQNIIVLRLFFAWWHSTNHDDFDFFFVSLLSTFEIWGKTTGCISLRTVLPLCWIV